MKKREEKKNIQTDLRIIEFHSHTKLNYGNKIVCNCLCCKIFWAYPAVLSHQILVSEELNQTCETNNYSLVIAVYIFSSSSALSYPEIQFETPTLTALSRKKLCVYQKMVKLYNL